MYSEVVNSVIDSARNTFLLLLSCSIPITENWTKRGGARSLRSQTSLGPLPYFSSTGSTCAMRGQRNREVGQPSEAFERTPSSPGTRTRKQRVSHFSFTSLSSLTCPGAWNTFTTLIPGWIYEFSAYLTTEYSRWRNRDYCRCDALNLFTFTFTRWYVVSIYN